jgi:hypothetical protein
MNDKTKRKLELENLRLDPRKVEETLAREFPEMSLEDAKQAVLEKINSEVDRIRQESQNRQEEYDKMLEDHRQKLEEIRADYQRRLNAQYQKIFTILSDFSESNHEGSSLVLLFTSLGKGNLTFSGFVSTPRILGLKDLLPKIPEEEEKENEKTSD